jgi:hypothetical protein
MKWVRKHPVLSVIAAVLLLSVAAGLIWKATLTSANQQRIDAITARGEPANLAALDKFYKAVPDSNNAALLWLDGSAVLAPNLSDAAGKITLQRGSRIDPEQLRPVIEALAANKDALTFFRRAAALKESRYPISLTQLPFPGIDHLTRVKGAAQALRAQAIVAVEHTNSALAAESLKGIFAAASSTAQEPLIISQLVRYAVDTIGVQTLQFALSGASFSEPELAAMQAAVSKADDPDSMARGLIGERGFFIFGLSDPRGYIATARNTAPRGLEQIASEVFLKPLVRASGFWHRDLRFGIDALTTNIAFARLPDPQRFHSMTNSQAITAAAKRGRYIFTASLLPAFEKFALRDANHRAQARTALVALAIERFRLANNGKLPDQLSSLVPTYLDKIPVDPFDGKPVRFKPLKTGYVVYCIGPDEKDDGGAERVRNAPTNSPEDVTFIVERPISGE